MAEIRYEFIATGVQTVRDGFKTIGQDAKDAGRQVDEGMRRMRASARETSRSGRVTTDYQQKLGLDVAKAQERAAVRQEAQQQRQIASATATRRREIAREISDRKTHEGRLEQIARSGADKRAEGERRHRLKLDQIKRQSESRLSSITDRGKEAAASREIARAFDKEILGKRRAYELDKKRKETNDSLKSELVGGIKGAVVGGAIATGALAVGIAGGATRDALRLQEVSNRLSINARGAGENAVDPTLLRKEFEQTAIKTPGVRSIDIAEAVSQFVAKTGNLDVARKSQGVFATVASATGSNVQDVATAAADLFEKFDINTVEGMADAMSALAFQGKAGAFELKDAASQFASLASAASRFGLDKGAEGVRVLGGLTQIARTGNKGPEATATAVNAMFRQFTAASTQKELANLGGVGKGVKVFKDKNNTQTRDIRELIVETISKAGGNQTKIGHIFGDEGMGAMSPMLAAFNTALKEATDKGLKGADANKYAENALRGYIDQKINAPGDYAELQKDAAQAQADATAKLTATWEDLTMKIGDSTIPVVQQFVDTLAGSPDTINAFVAVVDAAMGALSFFVKGVEAWAELLGISTKKPKSPEQVRGEERKKAEVLQGELERFDRKRGGSWDEEQRLRRAGKTKEADAMAKKLFDTAYLDDERSTLAAKFEAQKKAVGQANAAVTTAQDQQKNIRSAGAFANEYAKMLGPEEYKGQNAERAATVAKSLRDQTLNANVFTNEGALNGETEEARAFRLNQVKARREDLQNAGVTQQGQTGAQTADSGLGAIAARFAAAVSKFDAAAGKVAQQGQASIVPPP